jgi:hypothetical protein
MLTKKSEKLTLKPKNRDQFGLLLYTFASN